jgi:hypothetical protein
MAVVNLSDKEKRELSEQYDKNKQVFERSLSKDLIAFFAFISTEVFASFATSGLPPNMAEYQEELAAILKKSYRKTGTFFSHHIQRLMSEVEPSSEEHEELLEEVQEERSKIEAALLLLLIPFYNRQSREQAQFILRTTQKIIRDEQIKVLTDVAIAEAEALQAGEAVAGSQTSQAEVAQKIAKQVNKRNRNRVDGIASDQVGDVAQVAKQTESEEVVKVATQVGIAVQPRKTWITVGDSRVRKAHQRANKQERPLNGLYNVGGDLLEYPKDMSHGAGLDNTAGCRCDSVVEI